MVPSDVERLLRILTPSLALLGACAPTETKEVVEETKIVEETKEVVEDTKEVVEEPKEVVEEPKEVVEETKEVVEETKTPPPPPDPITKPMRDMPSCPSGTTCIDQATAKAFAKKGAKTDLGCPVELEAKPGKVSPRNLADIRRFDAAKSQETRSGGDADACCYAWTIPCPGGRPLLDAGGKPVFAPVRATWAAERAGLAGSPEALARAAQGWLDDAAMEHASVASFGRVALELLGLGAPSELVEGAHRAALDELRHTRMCLSLAERCGASLTAPGPLPAVPQRPSDLARFAADTFVEGCVGETIAALAMTRAATGASHADVPGILQQIADDESRHAALAWRMVAWAVDRGGPEVVAAVHEVAARMRTEVLTPAPRITEPEGLAALGRLDAAALAAVRADAWHGIVEPMLAKLGRSTPSRGSQTMTT